MRVRDRETFELPLPTGGSKMSTQSDFYMRRAAAERRLGALTGDPNVAAVHLEMAERYETLASDARAPNEKPALRIVPTERRIER